MASVEGKQALRGKGLSAKRFLGMPSRTLWRQRQRERERARDRAGVGTAHPPSPRAKQSKAGGRDCLPPMPLSKSKQREMPTMNHLTFTPL